MFLIPVLPCLKRLDERDDGSAIQNELANKTGQTTVPNIFVGEFLYYTLSIVWLIELPLFLGKQHVGGASDLDLLERTGQLGKLIAAL